MPDPISSGGHQVPSAYRHVSRTGSSPEPTSESRRSASTDRTDRSDSPRLGDDLSEAEQQMIVDRFPASEEKSLQVYGRSQNEDRLQPGGLGRTLDLRG